MYDILGYKIYAWTEGAKKLPKTDKYVMKKLASQKRKSVGHTFRNNDRRFIGLWS